MTSLSLSRGDRSAELLAEPPEQGSRPRLLRRAVAGGVAFVLVERLLSSGIVHGLPAVAVPVLLIVALPVAESLSRRIAVNGTLAMGWAPVLWWVRWPVEVNHAAIICGVAAAALCVWVLGGTSPQNRLSRLVPSVAGVDSLILVAAICGWVMMHNWALAATPQRALTLLLPGYDNVAHFNMFAMVRSHGATIDALGNAPDGTGWAFADYPQGFHALLATYAELALPQRGADLDELVVYTRAVSALIVFGVTVLVASICSVRRLRERPLVALPAVALVCTAFLWEPGAKLLLEGFGNFWLAAVAVSCALVISLTGRRQVTLAETAAVCGLLVATAHTWAPLLLVAGPAALALGRGQLRGAPRRGVHATAAIVGVVVLTALSVGKALVVLVSSVDVSTIVVAHGPIHGSSPLPLLVLVVVALYTCGTYAAWVRRRGDEPDGPVMGRQVRLLTLVPVLGVMASAALLLAQFQTLGTSSYYFVKFEMGFALVLAALTATVGGMLVDVVVPRCKSRPFGVLGSAVLVVTATQFFGHVPVGTAPMVSEWRETSESPASPPWLGASAAGIISASRVGSQVGSRSSDYLEITSDRGFIAMLPESWYHAINGTLTLGVYDRMQVLDAGLSTPGEAAPLARDLLRKDPGTSVIVSPEFVEPLRAQMGSPALAGRVRAWTADSVETQGER